MEIPGLRFVVAGPRRRIPGKLSQSSGFDRISGSPRRCPRTMTQSPGAMTQNPGTPAENPGTTIPIPRAPLRGRGTRLRWPEAMDSSPETMLRGRGDRSPDPGLRSHRPEARPPCPADRSGFFSLRYLPPSTGRKRAGLVIGGPSVIRSSCVPNRTGCRVVPRLAPPPGCHARALGVGAWHRSRRSGRSCVLRVGSNLGGGGRRGPAPDKRRGLGRER